MIQDQATLLRELVGESTDDRPTGPSPVPPRLRLAVAVASGKGGVGKTNVTVNLATALAQRGLRTVVLDADIGTANADVLCGIDPSLTLESVIRGTHSLEEVMVPGPGGFELIPGASGCGAIADLTPSRRDAVVHQLAALEARTDILLIDLAAGIGDEVMGFASAADAVMIVATPEPTSVTDAYALIKSMRRRDPNRPPELLINGADTTEEGREVHARMDRACRHFLDFGLPLAGIIPRDDAVRRAVRERLPFVLGSPASPAGIAVKRLAARLAGSPARDSHEPPRFLGRLIRWIGGRRSGS